MSDKPTFVLVSGYICAGKDTVAARFLKRLSMGGCRVKVASFAEAVKRDAAAQHQLDFALLTNHSAEGRAYKEKHRQKLIDVGMEGRRQNENYWVDRVFEAHRHCDIVIISDWRFPNECHRLRDLGAAVFCVRVQATQDARRRRGWKPDSSVDNDESETALDQFVGSSVNVGQITFVFNSEHENWDAIDEQIDRLCKYILPADDTEETRALEGDDCHD